MTAQLLLSLSILIVVHEWGHYITARWFNIKVEKFYLFFDFLFPLANVMNFSLVKYKKGDTEFGVGWFPLGGYVKIAGMVDESMDKEAMKAPAQDWEFRAKKPWQRLIVMLGGIIVNLIVGMLIFAGVLFFYGDHYVKNDYVNGHGGVHAMQIAEEIGIKTGDQFIEVNGKPIQYFDELTKLDVLLGDNSTYTIRRGDEIRTITIPNNFLEKFSVREARSMFVLPRVEPIIDRIADSTFASLNGLQKGDKIISVNGQPVTYFDEVRPIVHSVKGDTLTLKVLRNQTEIVVSGPFVNGKRLIGFTPPPKLVPKEAEVHLEYNFFESITMAPGRAFEVITSQVIAIKKMIKRDISVRKTVSGPIGMAQAFGPTWDWVRFWQITGLISMALAFMNLLPIPGLDGGYVVFLLYEMASGKEPNEKVFETALKIGMGLLLILMVFVFYNDIVKLFN